jgi:parallel beta-helix repeat protein
MNALAVILVLSSTCLLDSAAGFIVHESSLPVGPVNYQEEKFYVDSSTSHEPIAINGDANFSATALAEGWIGNGTAGAPYVIEDLDIDLGGADSHCISISSTSVYFKIRNCFLSGAIGYYTSGIYLTDVTNAELTSNICSGNTFGIEIIWSSEINMTNNICRHNMFSGISLYVSDSNRVIDNTCDDNSGSGIELIDSDSNIFSNNTCNNNMYGYLMTDSTSNTVINCTFKNNHYGMKVISSDTNTIADCCLEDNMYGISLEYLSSAVIASNTFRNCGMDFYDIQNSGLMLNFTSNTVNSKPLLVLQNQTNVVVTFEVGQVIVMNCSSIIIQDQTLDRCTTGVFVFQSINVTVKSIICTNNNRGILYLSSSNSSVFNNICDENIVGVAIEYTNYTEIYANNCTNNSNGISVYASNSILVRDNNCERNRVGIIISNANNVTVKENYCIIGSEISYGIYVVYSHNILLTSNILSLNMVGIYLEGCEYNEIENNVCTQSLIGISLYAGMNNILNNNTSNHNFYGILLNSFAINCTLERNTCDANEIGITLEYCGRISLNDNVCNNNYVGIDVFRSSQILVVDNHLATNNYCIHILGSDNISISSNTCIDYIKMGIRLEYSLWSIISFNNCTGSLGQSVGIYLHSSSSNTISNNRCVANNYGIQLTESNSTENVIIWNVFATNAENGLIDSTGNIIHHNFWSDYQGVDEDQDEIGDTPYNIPGTAAAQDDLPLMEDPHGIYTLVGKPNIIRLMMEIAVVIIEAVVALAVIIIILQKRRSQS